MGGDDKTYIRFVVVQRTLLWYPIDFMGKIEHGSIPPSFFALPFHNDLPYRYLNTDINSGNDWAASPKMWSTSLQ